MLGVGPSEVSMYAGKPRYIVDSQVEGNWSEAVYDRQTDTYVLRAAPPTHARLFAFALNAWSDDLELAVVQSRFQVISGPFAGTIRFFDPRDETSATQKAPATTSGDEG